ncbi:MAG: arginine--tRNA ligase [Candidatus Promineifilaceae bacterium]
MQLTDILAEMVRNAIANAQTAGTLPPFEIPDIAIERPRDMTHGDYATTMALRMAKLARMRPRSIAEAIVAHAETPEQVSEMSIAGPGFINIRLSQTYIQQLVEKILLYGSDFGRITTGDGKRAQVECVSANPTGPITIGRTRGGIIGDTLARLMRAAGYEVELEYYYNDAGRQIDMLGQACKIRYLQALGQTAELSADHYQGEYLVDIAGDLFKEHGDSLVDQPSDYFATIAKGIISKQQKASLHRIGIVHDTYFNESSIHEDGRLDEALKQLEENGYIYQADDAWWLKTTAFGDEKDRVAIRSTDGTTTYRMNDIVYHRDKAMRQFDVVVDIFGSDHHELAKEVKIGVQMLGYDVSFVHTLIHQFVNLIREGKEVKMSTRRGVYETLDDLADEVGPDPIRYFMLQRSANSRINFDLDLALEHSDKNPVYYIQNAHVRCAGILRKWQAAGNALNADNNADLSLLTHPKEIAFLKKALELSEVIELSVDSYEPHHITFYAYDLAAAFHPVYDACRVMGDGVSAELSVARLRFYKAAMVLMARVLSLMGMSAPDRM